MKYTAFKFGSSPATEVPEESKLTELLAVWVQLATAVEPLIEKAGDNRPIIWESEYWAENIDSHLGPHLHSTVGLYQGGITTSSIGQGVNYNQRRIVYITLACTTIKIYANQKIGVKGEALPIEEGAKQIGKFLNEETRKYIQSF